MLAFTYGLLTPIHSAEQGVASSVNGRLNRLENNHNNLQNDFTSLLSRVNGLDFSVTQLQTSLQGTNSLLAQQAAGN